jgi:hypothetical protein
MAPQMQKFADRGFRKQQKVRKVPLSLITPPRMQPDYYGWMSALGQHPKDALLVRISYLKAIICRATS